MTYHVNQRVARAKSPSFPGTVTTARSGIVRVHWDAGGEWNYQPRDLTPYVYALPPDEPAMTFTKGQRVVHDSDKRGPGTVTGTAQTVTVKWDDLPEPITYQPNVAHTILNYVDALPRDEPAMATLPQPGKDATPFPVHSIVRSQLDPYRGQSGTVTSHMRDDGTTLVRWGATSMETRQPTASLCYDPNHKGEQVIIPAAAVTYDTLKSGRPRRDMYDLPAVALTETEAKNRGTYYYSNDHTPGSGVHESVTAECCLEVAATWAAIAHRITTRQDARDKAAVQLEAEAFALYQASCEASETRAAGSWAQAIDHDGETGDGGEVIGVEADFIAIARAARKLHGKDKP